MYSDAIWQAFAETGDPLYYLLYKSNAQKEQSGAPLNTAPAEAQQPLRAGD